MKGGGPGRSDAVITCALNVNSSTVRQVYLRLTIEGLTATPERKRPDRIFERAPPATTDCNPEVRPPMLEVAD